MTRVTERETPAMQCTRMLVYWRDWWMKSLAVSKCRLRS